jgi:sugar/nucleoside kinase (ribokinase family)
MIVVRCGQHGCFYLTGNIEHTDKLWLPAYYDKTKPYYNKMKPKVFDPTGAGSAF